MESVTRDASVAQEAFLGSQQGFTNVRLWTGWAAQCLDKIKLLAAGILLAISATAGYILLHDNVDLGQITERIADTFEFPEQPYC